MGVVLDVLAWWDTFLRSPGLGGLAAVGAAAVAFGQLRRQAQTEAADRRTRETAARRARRDEQWWEAYRLAREDRPATPGTPREQDERLLRVLSAHAETDVQTAAIGSLIAAYMSAPPPPDEGTFDEHPLR